MLSVIVEFDQLFTFLSLPMSFVSEHSKYKIIFKSVYNPIFIYIFLYVVLYPYNNVLTLTGTG